MKIRIYDRTMQSTNIFVVLMNSGRGEMEVLNGKHSSDTDSIYLGKIPKHNFFFFI